MTEVTLTVRFMDDRDPKEAFNGLATHLLETFNDDGSIKSISDRAVLIEACDVLRGSFDCEAEHYEAQSPAENWAIDAFEQALVGNDEAARKLLDTYEGAPWNEYDGEPGEGQKYRERYRWDEEESDNG